MQSIERFESKCEPFESVSLGLRRKLRQQNGLCTCLRKGAPNAMRMADRLPPIFMFHCCWTLCNKTVGGQLPVIVRSMQSCEQAEQETVEFGLHHSFTTRQARCARAEWRRITWESGVEAIEHEEKGVRRFCSQLVDIAIHVQFALVVVAVFWAKSAWEVKQKKKEQGKGNRWDGADWNEWIKTKIKKINLCQQNSPERRMSRNARARTTCDEKRGRQSKLRFVLKT